MLFEKSFLLSEKEDYDKAYQYFDKAFSNTKDNKKKKSNFDTHLWILMKYMCIKPEKEEQVLNWVNHFYEKYRNKLGEYEPIVAFANTNEYLKNNILCDEIYSNLLKFLFHAM